MKQRITEKMVREWAAKHRPDVGISRENGRLGIWRRAIGPAHDFMTVGETWRHVAMRLGMIEPDEERQ